MVTFSNPRLRAEFDNWPSGKNQVNCVFHTEHKPGKGYRVGRTTTGATKYHTYGGKLAIVDGSDGKTYILQVGTFSPNISISRSDFMNASDKELGFYHYVSPEKEFLYAELLALIEAANK